MVHERTVLKANRIGVATFASLVVVLGVGSVIELAFSLLHIRSLLRWSEWLAVLCLVAFACIGLAATFHTARDCWLSSRMRVDAEGLSYAGRHFPWTEVTRVDYYWSGARIVTSGGTVIRIKWNLFDRQRVCEFIEAGRPGHEQWEPDT